MHTRVLGRIQSYNVDRPLSTIKRLLACTGPRIPDLDGLVVRPRYDVQVISRECYQLNPGAVTVCTSHILTDLSPGLDPDTMRRPSAENATELSPER